jgi:hypothetical protein
MSVLPSVAVAVLCHLASAMPGGEEPPRDIDALVLCATREDYAAAHNCIERLTALAERAPNVAADARVHRAFAATLYREIAALREWQRWFTARSEAEIAENESPEYEDGNTALLLADTVRFRLLPYADLESERVLFDALLATSVMNGDMERGIARYGQRAAPATLDLARSDDADRRRIAYVVLGWMLALTADDMLAPALDPGRRDAAAVVITAGLQESDPSARLTAIQAARRGRVQAAVPMLRVLAVTLPDDEPHRLRQAAADAVATLAR